jgi:hypothetical protein
LGVFGIHRDRQGFSVVEVTGHRPAGLARADGSQLFDPTLPGGRAAGLFSISGMEELLELGARSRELGAAIALRSAGLAPSSQLGAPGSKLPAPDSQLPATSS